ncbi:MAG TPA: ATP-binding protein [Candidatus Saccharimonadales bacterium]|nr:ATP-binding protein [Candidatus Saccharimonadales bacterium]
MSIKLKLITLLLLIGLIPTLAVGVVSYVAISRELKSNTNNQIQSTAVKQQQKINALLQTRQEEVSQLSNQYDLQVALAQYVQDGSQASRAAIDQVVQTKKNDVSDVQAISISDLGGKIISSTLDGTRGTTNASAKAFAKADQATDVAVKQDAVDGIDKLYSYTQLSVNKQTVAVMMVVFRIDDVTAAVQDYTGLGTTGETIVGSKDANGHMVSLFPLRFNTEAALRTNLDSLLMGNHSDGVAYDSVKDYRGKNVIIAASSVGFSNWIVAAKIDSSEALAPISQLKNALIGIALFSSVVIIVVAAYFARFFTEPILRIARISKQIGQGDFSARSSVHRQDEIGALSNSVNGMGESLGQFVAHIESQRSRLEIILNSTEEAIVALNPQGIITTANKATAQLVGLPDSQLIGRNIAEIFDWSHAGAPFAVAYTTIATTYPDLQYKATDGSVHFVTLNVAHVRGGQPAHLQQIIVTIHDETKSRELENMKIDFVSMAAHELRTPLAAIKGYLELISYKEKNVSAETQKYLVQASKSTVELGSLINNLLDVTRIERGTLTLNMDTVDLAANVWQAVQDAQFTAADKNITLTFEGSKHGYSVEADPIAIHEVVNNLISNAVKYTKDGGRVAVAIADHDTNYEVTVKDSGIGIPKLAVPNLFTKFYRVHGGLNSGSTGTGLGLFISKSIVERHNGTIKVVSQEGVGSTFSFTLPKPGNQPSQSVQDDQMNTRRQRGWTTQNITR